MLLPDNAAYLLIRRNKSHPAKPCFMRETHSVPTIKFYISVEQKIWTRFSSRTQG